MSNIKCSFYSHIHDLSAERFEKHDEIRCLNCKKIIAAGVCAKCHDIILGKGREEKENMV